MCLVALALGASRRFPLVLASNRDEFFERASAPLDWWQAPGCGRRVLAGRDLAAGGSWCALEAGGRLALVTNVRDPARAVPQARSRGELVTRWLCADGDFAAFWQSLDPPAYNGFNLVAADLRRGCWNWASNADGGQPRSLQPGIHGLSNARLDTPWPKVTRLKARLAAALAAHEDAAAPATDALAAALFAALADTGLAADADLPATGVSRELERQLSPAFIRMPNGRYGTRCSTLLIQERLDGRLLTRVCERSFEPDGTASAQRSVSFADWPAADRA